MILKVNKIHKDAKLPVCANPGEDLGFDIFSLCAFTLWPGYIGKLRTGIAIQMDGRGFIIKDRSSLAARGIITLGGVIDAGYRGEIFVNMASLCGLHEIKAGDKIAQMVPTKVYTDVEVEEYGMLPDSARGIGGYGSTGA